MGTFFHTAIIQNCDIAHAKSAIENLADAEYWDLDFTEFRYKELNGCTHVIFSELCAGYEDLAEILSVDVKRPVLLLYIYDGDYWGYYFYDKGKFVDVFNPRPDYFERVSDEERKRTAGNSARIAQYFKVDESEIKNYLVEWTDELISLNKAAYEDDEFVIGEDWQIADFMKTLGYPYWDEDEPVEGIPE